MDNNIRDIVRDASELGLKPGEFPRELVVNDRAYRIAAVERNEEGELVSVIYSHPATRDMLTVFND